VEVTSIDIGTNLTAVLLIAIVLGFIAALYYTTRKYGAEKIMPG
jgi:hypothetical protein